MTYGSTFGVGQAGLLDVNDEVSRSFVGDGVDRIVTYRWEPDGRFTVMISVRNTSPLPVVLSGEGSPPSDVASYLGFWLEDLAANLSDGYGFDEGVLEQPTMEPTTIQPGEELAVWARFRVSPTCEGQPPLQAAPDWPEGGYSAMSTNVITLRTQVLGVPQTTRLAMPTEVQLVNGGPDAIAECPAAA